MKKIILYFFCSLAAFLLMEFACDLMKPIADAIPETEYLIGTLQTRTIVKSLWFLVIGTTFFIFFFVNGDFLTHFFAYYIAWHERKQKEIGEAMNKSDPK